MATAKWRGSRELTETPDSPEWDFSGDGTTCTRTFQGPFDVCLAQRPLRGSSMAGFSGLAVDKSRVKKSPGGKGTLTITAFGVADSVSAAPFAAVEEKYEVEWTETQKALITNPCFSATGAFPLDDDDRCALQKWEDCPDASVKKIGHYYDNNDTRDPNPGTGLALSVSAWAYAKKILKGEDSWTSYTPIARKTSLTVEPPTTSMAGRRETPDDFPCLPGPYQWMKTADRSTRSGKKGKWEQSEEWTGVDAIDEDLYPGDVVL